MKRPRKGARYRSLDEGEVSGIVASMTECDLRLPTAVNETTSGRASRSKATCRAAGTALIARAQVDRLPN